MKIVFVSDAIYPYNKGGKETRIYEITRRLVKYGHNVHIFTMKWWEGPQVKVENGVTLHGICKLKKLYTKKEGRRSLWQAFYFGVKLFRPLLRESFDILEADHIPYFHLIFCKLVCLLKRKKLIVTWHEVWGREKWCNYLGKLKGLITYIMEKVAMKLPDQIIAVSKTTADKLENIFKIKSKKIVVIPNGINIEEVNSAPVGNLKSDVVFAGRLVKHKKVDYLIRAIKIVKEKYKSDIKCVVIGDGPERSNLEKLTRQLNLDKNILFVGFLKNHSDVYSYFKASKVFVLPSINEGFGITVLEANACGLPAIVVEHPDNAAKDLIVEGKNGYICRLDEKEIANKIKQINFVDNLEEMKRYCIEISKKYQWKNIIAEVFNFYTKLTNANKGKKICILIDGWYPYWGGGQIHVWEVCKILVRKYNCQIDIYTRSLKDETGKIFNKNESYFNGKLNIYRCGIPSQFLNVFARIWWCFYVVFPLIFKQYDIIHAQAFLSAIPAKILKFIKKIPLIYSVHGTALNVPELANGVFMKIQRWLERKLICGLKYDQEISVSNDFLKYKNVNKNIIVIPNGVDVSKFDSIKVEKNKTPQILFVGRFYKEKGLEYLIKASKILVKENRNFKIILVGWGEEENNLKDLITKLKLEQYFYFAGKLAGEKLIKFYKSSHVFVLPSISEGQPLTLLEAWAAKLPVVVTDVGDNREYVKNGINGYLIPARNVNMIANSILKILKNYQKAEKMGQNGYNLVKEKFSWENTASKIYDVYKKYFQSK